MSLCGTLSVVIGWTQHPRKGNSATSAPPRHFSQHQPHREHAPAVPWRFIYSFLAQETQPLCHGAFCSSSGAGQPEQWGTGWGVQQSLLEKKAVIINRDSRVILFFMSFFSLSPWAPRRRQMFSSITWRAMCLFALFLWWRFLLAWKDEKRGKSFFFFFFFPFFVYVCVCNSDLLQQMQSAFL